MLTNFISIICAKYFLVSRRWTVLSFHLADCDIIPFKFWDDMGNGRNKYNRRDAEIRFARVYKLFSGNSCVYCGIESDGNFDHQPPIYVLHRFANGGLVSRKTIREQFGICKLVPCCTICNMGLGAFHGASDNDRRREIVNWFLVDDRHPEDQFVLRIGEKLIEKRLRGRCSADIYEFAGVGRVIYMAALSGFIDGQFCGLDDFPEWLRIAQSELAVWLRGAPRRKSSYFLDMANLESYELLPHARSDPRGQFDSPVRVPITPVEEVSGKEAQGWLFEENYPE